MGSTPLPVANAYEQATAVQPKKTGLKKLAPPPGVKKLPTAQNPNAQAIEPNQIGDLLKSFQ